VIVRESDLKMILNDYVNNHLCGIFSVLEAVKVKEIVSMAFCKEDFFVCLGCVDDHQTGEPVALVLYGNAAEEVEVMPTFLTIYEQGAVYVP
jgi:hypothetical protein